MSNPRVFKMEIGRIRHQKRNAGPRPKFETRFATLVPVRTKRKTRTITPMYDIVYRGKE